MHPQTFDEGGFQGGFRSGQADTLDDPGKVPQVEQIMGLCRSGQEVLGRLLVHRHSGLNDLRGKASEWLREIKPGEKKKIVFVLDS